MASPQVEDGYTRFANELLEALIELRIPGQELRIVLAIARKTYGWGKKSDTISYGQLSKMTGVPRARVIEHVKNLVSKKILGSHNNGTRQPLTIWINKNFEGWEPSPKKETSPKHETKPSPNNGNKPSPNNGTHKRKERKERNSTQYPDDFERFWSAYPVKKKKKEALKAWNKAKQDLPPIDELVEIIEKNKRLNKQWLKDGGQFIPHPATWLNAGQWLDELEADSSSQKSPKYVT